MKRTKKERTETTREEDSGQETLEKSSPIKEDFLDEDFLTSLQKSRELIEKHLQEFRDNIDAIEEDLNKDKSSKSHTSSDFQKNKKRAQGYYLLSLNR